jgi:hypothetical protein
MPTHASDIEPVRPETADEPEAREKSAPPGTFNGSTRVNVAFPFSKINVQDPSKELAELSALVAELITVLEGMGGGRSAGRSAQPSAAQLAELRRRSEDLATRRA